MGTGVDENCSNLDKMIKFIVINTCTFNTIHVYVCILICLYLFCFVVVVGVFCCCCYCCFIITFFFGGGLLLYIHVLYYAVCLVSDLFYSFFKGGARDTFFKMANY